MKQIFILIFFICYSLIGVSQKTIDSLRIELNKANTACPEPCFGDTLRIHLYLDLGDAYEFTNYDSSLFWYNKALNTSQNNLTTESSLKTNYETLKALSLKCMGIIYYYQGNYDLALEYYDKSLNLFIELKNALSIASCYSNIGVIHQEQYRYDEAVTYYLKALSIFEKQNNLKGYATCNMNLGNVFSLQQNFKKSEDYYLKSIKIFQGLKDEYSIGTCYNNLGGNFYEELMYDKSIDFYKKALNIKIKLNDRLGIADTYNNLGNVFLSKKEIDEAYSCYIKSLDIGLKFENNSVISTAYVSLADIMLDRNKIKEAVDYAEKGLTYARKENLLDQITFAYKHLSEAFETMGDFKKALLFKKKFISCKDSMFSSSRDKLVAEMDTKYQSEKKQQQIIIQTTKLGKKEAEIKQQRTKLIAFIVGFFLLLIFLIFAIYNYRQKRKANILLSFQNTEIQQKNEEITSQRDEIEAQRDKVSLQNQLLAEQKQEITDSITYAKRIQEAVLPDLEEILSHKLQNSNSKFQGGLGLEAFILFKPKSIVSGDFYWTTRIGEKLLITVADCTGHGVPGAFMSMLGISFLNEIVLKKDITQASYILDELRNYIIEALKQHGIIGEQKDGMDMALCVINMNTLEMQFAGANNPCYVIAKEGLTEAISILNQIASPSARNDEYRLIELKGNKMPVAIYEDMVPFSNQVLQLNKGDIIYLKSDGFEDQYGWPTHKKFLSKNLKQLLTANSQLPMANQKEILNSTIENWMNGQEQIDDITILGIKI